MNANPLTTQNKVKRLPDRGKYDRETIYSILDAGLICHVGFVQDGEPVVIPTLYARLEDSLVLHGSKASRMMKHIQAGNLVSVAVTLVDGLVLARSVFHHSVNYRSVVLFGSGSLVDEPAGKLRALETLTEHILPGRWRDARKPNPKELAATSVVSIPIEVASAKMRSGPVSDDQEDYSLPVWAGVVPIRMQWLTPEADVLLNEGISVPEELVRRVD